MSRFGGGGFMRGVIETSVNTISYYKISVNINIHNLM